MGKNFLWANGGQIDFSCSKKPANPDKIGILNLQFRDEVKHSAALASENFAKLVAESVTVMAENFQQD